ncbi:CGNR zinc finger [Streptomyces sp. YIM 130001]|uniref:CGNR zinc finger domain-containing protein n=1 Tax=Streptomyces sp. YIM 130001 TaxID=2259644 RepID=UPI000E65DC66|nr:ABATE domain-containing protein [Streptomyces sp. YIM 130001]RII19821.1 CGNR zinc finger [Streptomyces sp. YIM 130001]
MASDLDPAPYELRFDSGRVCLDLLATAHPGERLDSVRALRAWLIGAGLVPAREPLRLVDAGCLLGFRELRADLAQLIPGAVPPGAAVPPAVLARVNEQSAVAPPAPRAAQGPGGAGLVRALHGEPTGSELLAAVARDAVELLTDPVARSRVRRCEAVNCPLVYLDTSRGRRRRWCSSEVCGNRERVARHRRRAASLADR